MSEILEQKLKNSQESVNDILRESSTEEIQDFISDCYSWADVFRKLGFDIKRRDIRQILDSKNLDISHFNYKPNIRKSLEDYSKDELQDIANRSNSWKAFCINLGYYGYKPNVKRYIVSLGVNVDHFKYKPYEIIERERTFRDYSKEELEEVVRKSKNWDEVAISLGYATSNKGLRNYIKSLNIDVSHFNSEIRKTKSLKNYTKDELQKIVNSVDNWKDLCEKLNNKACGNVKRTIIGLGIDYSHFIWQNIKKVSDEEFIQIVKRSNSFEDVARELGYYSATDSLKERIKRLNIDISHFHTRPFIKIELKKLYDTYDDIDFDASKFFVIHHDIISIEELQTIINNSYNWTNLCQTLGYSNYQSSVKERILKLNLNIPFLEEAENRAQIEIIKQKELENIPVSLLEEVVKKSYSWKDLRENIINDLNTFYSKIGYKRIKNYILKLGIDISHFKDTSKELNISNEDFVKLVKESNTWKGLYSKLGFEKETLFIKNFCRNKIKELNIDISHFSKKEVIINFTKEEFISAYNKSSSWSELLNLLGYVKINSYLKNKVVDRADLLGIDYSKLSMTHLIWNEQEYTDILKEIYGDNITFVGPFKGFWEETDFLCKKHGTFKRKPYELLRGKACPVCKYSKGELAVMRFFRKNNIVYEYQKSFEDCRYIKPLPFDFGVVFNDQQYLIEFQGTHHFKPVQYNGCSWEEAVASYEMTVLRDKIKKEYCFRKGLGLIEILSTKEIPEKLEFLIKGKNTTNN